MEYDKFWFKDQRGSMSEPKSACSEGREALAEWEKAIKRNSYEQDSNFRHTVSYHLPELAERLNHELAAFGQLIPHEVEPLVAENNRAENLPRIAAYDGIGNPINEIIHHPSYKA